MPNAILLGKFIFRYKIAVRYECITAQDYKALKVLKTFQGLSNINSVFKPA